MDVLQISPPKHFIFQIPNDLHRVLTITNLTLRSVYVCVLKSHEYQLNISKQSLILEAFQQIKVDVVINWSQESSNMSVGKLRVYYLEIQEDASQQQLSLKLFNDNQKVLFQQISITFNLDLKLVRSVNYSEIRREQNISYQSISKQVDKKYYLMKKVFPKQPNSQQQKVLTSPKLKNEIFNHLQHLNYVSSIEQIDNNQTFLMEFQSNKQDICDFISFVIENIMVIYSIRRIVSYGQSFQIPTLVSIDEDMEEALKKDAKNMEKTSPKKMKVRTQEQQKLEKTERLLPNSQIIEFDQNTQNHVVREEQKIKKKGQFAKQSFIIKGDRKRDKRRNKSEEKIVQNSSQEDEQQLFKSQLLNLRKAQTFQTKPIIQIQKIKVRHEIKINQTNIQMNQKVLNIFFEKKQLGTMVYVLLRDCVRCFVIEDPSFKKVISFDPIDEENIGMPCPIDIYKQELIFGNQSYLFWVNLQTGYNEWKYVQRKYIYALAIIQQLSIVAIGGRNFSKLSYFGKQTSRSNIKLYSSSQQDKHDHLFTYDIPGNNVGNVISMAYITAPPNGTKLLLTHTLNAQGKSCFYFFRIKAFNKFEVFGELQLDQLGILNLLKFKYNKQTCKVVCMETLGETSMDTFKKLKITCQYQKVEVSTEGFKFPLKRFISYHMGGSKDSGNRQWMSFVQQNGRIFHIYDFQSNKYQTQQLGKGQIKQIFPIYNGKYLVICSDTIVKIRQKIQVQIRQ